VEVEAADPPGRDGIVLRPAPARTPPPAFSPIAGRNAPLVRVVFGEAARGRGEAQPLHQGAGRHTGAQQFFGQKQPIGVEGLRQSGKTGESHADVGQRLVAAPPMVRGVLQMAQRVGGRGTTLRGGEQGEEAIPVLLQRENRRAERIARHVGENRSCAEDEPVVADLGRVGNRPRPRALFKSILQQAVDKHGTLH